MTVLLVLGVASACSAGSTSLLKQVDPVARVNGDAITAGDFSDYSSVFLDPSGQLTVPRITVLISLINQSLALREASRLEFIVDPQQIEAVVEATEHVGLTAELIGHEGGLDAFRARTRTRILFEAVKAHVTLDVSVSDREILAYFQSHPASFLGESLDDVRLQIRDRIRQQKVDDEWTGWLASQRACASIEILDPSLSGLYEPPDEACPAGSTLGEP